jgi:hypothetical protein
MSQQPAAPLRPTRDGDAQLQLVRRYSKLLRESAAVARSGSAQARRNAGPRRTSVSSDAAGGG